MLNGDDNTDLRDFVYLDVERVKSLLAQLDRGLLSDRSDSVGSNKSVEGNAGVSIPAFFSVGSAGQYVSTDQSTETRTLHDFVYTQTEEKLLELQRITRLPSDVSSDRIRSSGVRATLSPVEYVLVTGKVDLSDYDYMIEMLENFNELSRIFTEFSYQKKIDVANGKAKSAMNAELQRAIASNRLDEKYVKNLLKVLRFFVEGRLIIRSLPFESDPNIRIVGPLHRELLRDSLDNIRFKFGSSPTSDWTVFGQIAAVPQKDESRAKRDLEFFNDIERALSGVFEAMRAFEDPFRVRYPEIAITPIAVYRN